MPTTDDTTLALERRDLELCEIALFERAVQLLRDDRIDLAWDYLDLLNRVERHLGGEGTTLRRILQSANATV